MQREKVNGSGHVLESDFREVMFGWMVVLFAEGNAGKVADRRMEGRDPDFYFEHAQLRALLDT